MKRGGKLLNGSWKALLLALAVQVLLVAIAAYVGVFEPVERESPVFKGQAVEAPERAVERQQVAREMAAMGSPSRSVLAVADALSPVPEPPLPPDGAEFDPIATEFPVPGAWLAAQAGLTGLEAPGAKAVAPLSFLGIEERARGFVVAVDVSLSVKNKAEEAGMPLTHLQAETQRLIEQGSARQLFNLIQFSRRYDAFAEQLIPATEVNRAAAKQWLNERFVTNGMSLPSWQNGTPNGIELVLTRALAMQPEAVFVITDASFQRDLVGQRGGETVPWEVLTKAIAEAQAELTDPARLHFITLGAKARDVEALRQIAVRWGGSVRSLREGRLSP